MKFRSLQRRMGRDLAWRKLRPAGPMGLLFDWFSGPVRGLAEIYIPYRTYRISVNDRRLRSVRCLAVDAAAGTLDPYEFAALPEVEAWEEVTSRNCHPAVLEEHETRKIAMESSRRLFFSRGFFRLSSPQIEAELLEPEFYVPYWAGFYGDERNLRIKVFNAARQTVEGTKLRQLIQSWLLQTSAEEPAIFPPAARVQD